MLARFTFTRGADGRFTVTAAEAVPLQIVLGADAVTVRPADPATVRRGWPRCWTGGAPSRQG